MNRNPLIFNDGVPTIKGTWINPSTGNQFTVRDTFFEDNELVIKTTTGKIIKYNDMKDYVQISSESNNKNTPPPPTPKNTDNIFNKQDYIPSEVLDILDDTSYTPLTRIYDDKSEVNSEENKKININEDIISRVLKDKTNPSVDIHILWKDFPAEEIKVLRELLNIPPEDIINWYINTLNMTNLLETSKDSLKKFITTHISNKQVTDTTQSHQEKQTPKSTNKKNKK